MSLQEVKEQAFKLSVSDQLALVNLIVKSLQSELNNQTKSLEQPSAYLPGSSIQEHIRVERTALISRMREFLKTDKSAPTAGQTHLTF